MPRQPELRKDARSWLIYDSENMEGAVRALEMVALGIVGQHYRNHPDLAMRGIANTMLKLAKARMEVGLGLKGDGTTDELREATRCATAVFEFLDGKRTEYPVAEADQLYATLFHLDSRLSQAGLSGPGTLRAIARGET